MDAYVDFVWMLFSHCLNPNWEDEFLLDEFLSDELFKNKIENDFVENHSLYHIHHTDINHTDAHHTTRRTGHSSYHTFNTVDVHLQSGLQYTLSLSTSPPDLALC